jgi:PD-(D/E)XK nuclease superfamily
MSAEAFVKPRIVSNSEINAWRECQRKYYYSYDLGIEPTPENKGQALKTGVIGHGALQRYFMALQEKPGDFDYAANMAKMWLAMFMADSNYPSEVEAGNLVLRRLHEYFQYFPEKHPGAQVISIEDFRTVDLTDQFSFGFTPDLILQDGPITYLWDHKWTYNFWSQTEIDTKGAGQIVKYYWALKVLGIHVDQIMLGEIRYRERQKNPYTWDEMFRETSWTPSANAMKQLMVDQVKDSRSVVNHRQLSLEERERTVTRNLGTAACKYCDFASLCIAELNGEDVTEDIKSNFQPKSYDYNKPSEVESLVGAANMIESRPNERDY